MVNSKPTRGRIETLGLGVLLAFIGVTGAACKPEFAERYSNVTGPRVLGVSSNPPEANPIVMKGDINYAVLFVDQTGPRDDVSVGWAFCTTPTPPSELGSVSQSCLEPAGPQLIQLSGGGVTAAGALPSQPNPCRQFGPNPPETDGGPPGRPADPDPTGGFYQPVRLIVNANPPITAIGQTRLHCDLAGATSDVQHDYALRYRENTNPAIDGLSELGANQQDLAPYDGTNPSLTVSPGQNVDLRLRWAACDANVPCPAGAMDATMCTEPDACGGAESYVLLDLESRVLREQRESMRASWFSNAGSFANDHTGRSEDESATTFTDNTWTAPDTPGDAWLWVVLRDSRGGTTWNTYRVTVR